MVLVGEIVNRRSEWCMTWCTTLVYVFKALGINGMQIRYPVRELCTNLDCQTQRLSNPSVLGIGGWNHEQPFQMTWNLTYNSSICVESFGKKQNANLIPGLRVMHKSRLSNTYVYEFLSFWFLRAKSRTALPNDMRLDANLFYMYINLWEQTECKSNTRFESYA